MKKFLVSVNGSRYEVEVEEVSGFTGRTSPAETKPAISTADLSAVPAPSAAPAGAAPEAAPVAPAVKPAKEGSQKITSPMPGTILKINAEPGQPVKKGDVLCVLEAMKMENDIVSPNDGVIAGYAVTRGSSVNAGDTLVTLE
ncbi:MAG: biotin/lipoyl-containing protein [Saccharofermentanales bacterium]